VECKLRCVNFRRVSDPARTFWPAFRTTGISDNWCRSTTGVIGIGLGTSRSGGENFGCTWEYLGALETNLGALTTSLGTPMSAATSLGAPWITVEQSEKNIFFGNAAGAPGNHSYYLSFHNFWNSCIQFVFSSMYLCIDIPTHLHTAYLDWLQAVVDSNSRCAWKWRYSELRDALQGHDRARFDMHLEKVFERIWRYTWRPWWSELRVALRDHDQASLEIHSEVVIKRVSRYTWRT